MSDSAVPLQSWLGAPSAASADRVWQRLRHTAAAPYRSAGRFAWRFARGKLLLDPVFRAMLESGAIAPRARVLDVGCGQGLLGSLLCACDAWAAAGAWPAGWAPTPTGTRYTGIELMPRDVARAHGAIAALGRVDAAPQVLCADMCHAELPQADTVVMLDVLHYVDRDAQQRLLQRVHLALSPDGLLLLRVGDAADRRGFAISQWVDRVVTRARGHRAAAVHGRTLAEWTALLHGIGFTVQARPMSQGTPFANVLLVCRREAS